MSGEDSCVRKGLIRINDLARIGAVRTDSVSGVILSEVSAANAVEGPLYQRHRCKLVIPNPPAQTSRVAPSALFGKSHGRKSPGLLIPHRSFTFFGNKYVNPANTSHCVEVEVKPWLNPASNTRFFFAF